MPIDAKNTISNRLINTGTLNTADRIAMNTMIQYAACLFAAALMSHAKEISSDARRVLLLLAGADGDADDVSNKR